MKIKVYSLLTLTRKEILRALPSAIIDDPIERGDLRKDRKNGVNVTVIIDGKFDNAWPITPGEIMDALRAGIRIYGSSSMGALRAAETHRFGMVGHGKIFELVRSTVFRDDLLGQLIVLDEKLIKGIPLIDFHFNLLELERTGQISKAHRVRAHDLYSRVHFSQRSNTVLAALIDKHLSFDSRTARLIRKAAFEMGSQKRRDALGLLSRVKKDLTAIERQNEAIRRQVAPSRRGTFKPFWNDLARKG